MRRRPGRAVLCAVAMFSLWGLASAPHGVADTYTGGATFVARDGTGGTIADAGGVVCDGSGGGNSVGGACIPWSAGGTAISVVDDEPSIGTDVAFQVCVDHDGNRQCGGSPTVGGCDDALVFSHFDDGTFSNPLAVPSPGFKSGCPGGFPGWVVFICEGAHNVGVDAHEHAATSGTITSVSTTGGASGQFCNNPPFQPGKAYRLAPPDADVCTISGHLELGAPLNSVPRDSTFQFSGTTFDCDGNNLGGRYAVTASGQTTGVAAGETCWQGQNKNVGTFSGTKTGASSTGSNTGPASIAGTVLHLRGAGFVHVQGSISVGGVVTATYSGDFSITATHDENGPNSGAASKCSSVNPAVGVTEGDIDGTAIAEPI